MRNTIYSLLAMSEITRNQYLNCQEDFDYPGVLASVEAMKAAASANSNTDLVDRLGVLKSHLEEHSKVKS